MTAQTIAENYINGNHSEVKRMLGEGGADAVTIAARTMHVYFYLLGIEQTNFRNWLINNYSDI